MSREALAQVIQRSISDGAFRRQLASDPTGALRGYDLSTDEIGAIRSGDPKRLTSLGVEQRMSKAFNIWSDGVVGQVSYSVSSDLGASGTGAHTGGTDATGNAVITSGSDATGYAVRTSGADATGNAVIVSGDPAVEPRDIEPVDLGGTTETGSAMHAVEPRDIEPVDIGDSAPLSKVMTADDPAHALGDDTNPDGPQWFHTLTPGDPVDARGVVDDDAGRWPGETGQHFADDAGGGASTSGEAGDGPEIQS